MAHVLHTQEVALDGDVNTIAVTPYVTNYSRAEKENLIKMLREQEGDEVKILRFTQSLCPGCAEEEKWDSLKLNAVVYVKNNKVWLIKQCATHGVTKALYWADYEMYKKAESFQDPGIEIHDPHVDKTKSNINCPSDCGICSEHESQTALGNIVLTNRCDLSCWYCFFYAKEGDQIYEPTREQIQFMLKRMKNTKPVGANAVQLTGGEPTLRDDLIEIIEDAREIGYAHVQLNTNGINLALDPELCKKIANAGSRVLYMSCDGVTAQTNPKNYWEVPRALDNCSKAGIGVVLVPTIIGGVNDHELGDIVRFGFGNLNVVRAVNFQPVSLVGRMPEKERMKQRITIPGAIKRLEAQTDGQIGKEAWFTIPCVKNITDFIEAIREAPRYRLSNHFACGMATYIFKDNDKMVPITDFFDVQGFFEYIGGLTDELKNNGKLKSVKKTAALSKLALNLNRFVDNSKKPADLKFSSLLANALKGDSYRGLASLHYKSLFVGMMHFQDPYNWDIDRIHKCNIHYASPDGRVLPFCTFNVIPAMYRDALQGKYSIPKEEWEKQTGKSIKEGMYKRNYPPAEVEEINAFYGQFRKTLEKPEIEPDWGWAEVRK